jgi:hypothetical protein
MRTYNKHPQWYNQPLRLSETEKNNPFLVIDDFFQCYHLNEVREMLWNWLVEVLSSAHGISCDPHERNNQIYFYEKLEALVEAARVMQKQAHKKMKKRRRRRR